MSDSSGNCERSLSVNGILTDGGDKFSFSWSDSGSGCEISSAPAPQASKTAHGDGVPDFVRSNVRSLLLAVLALAVLVLVVVVAVAVAVALEGAITAAVSASAAAVAKSDASSRSSSCSGWRASDDLRRCCCCSAAVRLDKALLGAAEISGSRPDADADGKDKDSWVLARRNSDDAAERSMGTAVS